MYILRVSTFSEANLSALSPLVILILSRAFALIRLALPYLVLFTLHYFTYLALKKNKSLSFGEVTVASKASKTKSQKSSSSSNVNK